MQSRRTLALATVLLFFASGCGHLEKPVGAEVPRAPIYLSVLREQITRDRGYFEGRFPDVYVLDTADSTISASADPSEPRREPITAADQRAIVTGLAGIANVRFVDDPESVLVRRDGCPSVRGSGVLIALAPPTGNRFHLEVAVSTYLSCSGGSWVTFVLERDRGAWTVTGDTGVGGAA